jgi:guanine nucleotide-binding protein subunit beta-2-like 1 protein
MAEEPKEEKLGLYFKGYLIGHNGWVTSLAMGSYESKPMLVSGSRDKTLIRWQVDAEPEERTESIGKPVRQYKGHSHFIQDITLSQDSNYALSASWDKTIRLWSIKDGESKKLFQGHTKDVLTVALSSDNKLVLTGGRDSQLKLWSVNGENKHTVENAHQKWISCIRFSDAKYREFYTAGWDNEIGIWDSQTFNKKATLKGHTGFITCLAVAPNGTILGSGSKDGKLNLWDINGGAVYRTLIVGKTINCIAFSRAQAWVAIGTEDSIQIWDIKNTKMLTEVILEPHKKDAKCKQSVQALSICFDGSSARIYVGCQDSNIRVFELSKQ